MVETLHQILAVIVEYSVVFFEYFGVFVLLMTGISGAIDYLKKQGVHLKLAKGLALGLEFLLVGEILHTVILESMDDIFFIACLIVIRMFLAIIINHEIEAKIELNEHEKHAEE